MSESVESVEERGCVVMVEMLVQMLCGCLSVGGDDQKRG